MIQKLVLSILGLIAINFQSFSQKIDSLFTEDLQKISLSSLENNDFLVISNTNCISCVQYLMKSELSNNVIIITQNLSLIELQRLKSYYAIKKKSTIYFYNNLNSSSVKGPFIILNNKQIVSYDLIFEKSNGFTQNPKKFYNYLKQTLYEKQN